MAQMTCIKCKGKSRDSRSAAGHLTYEVGVGTVLEPHVKKETKR